MSADASSAIIRTNATKKAPRNKPQGDRALTVYNAEMTHCYTVPQDRVAFVPSPISKDRQLSLCPEYTESATCPRGESCTGVHANVDGLEKLAIHINFAWKDAESVSYARLTPGETLSILAPNNRPPMEQLASELILVTKGSLSHQQDPSSVPPPRPLSHCAHYYFNRVCNRGEQCSFIHAVNIDATSVHGQLAMAPQVVHRSTKSTTSTTPPSTDDAIATCSSLSGADAKQQCFVPVAASEQCSESGYTSDDSSCSGKTLGPLSEASSTAQSPAASMKLSDATTTLSPRRIYKVCGNRVLIFSQHNKDVVAFRHNPYY